MAKYRRKKAKEGMITLGELKAYIAAIEDMFGDDWTPSKEQWVKIRGKIMMVDDSVEETTVEHVIHRPGRHSVGEEALTFDEQANEEAILRSFPRGGGGGLPPDAVVAPGGAAPAGPSALDAPPDRPFTPPQPSRNPLLSTGGQVKTPDNPVPGKYDTPFV